MAKGLLDSPNLDDRVWQDIVDEATALIPYYNPEWTDHNRTDLGITLVELFAWLVEGMIYRLNRVPPKNFVEFLNLIGITRDPETPATVMLTYRMAPLAPPLLLPRGNQVATQQTNTDPAIVFETDDSVQLLPINLTTALYIHKVVFDKYKNVTGALVAAPLTGMQVTIAVGQSITIALGFDQATALPVALRFAFRAVAAVGDLQVQWAYSQGALAPSAWPLIPGVMDGTDDFTRNSTVTATVPVGWTVQAPGGWAGVGAESLADAVTQPLFWIGIRVSNLLPVPYLLQIDSILFNSVHASSALTVTQPELLGTSDGSPFQVFSLKHVPLYETPGTPDQYAHLVLQVRQPLLGGAFGPWTTWTRVDDFAHGAGAWYRLNPVTGDVSFGNYDPVISPDGHGTIPPNESEIQALTYRYVAGGEIANVPPSTITVLRTPAPGVIAATNPGGAANGADEESIEDTKRRGPEALRNRYRAVTAADYEYLAREASTEVRKVRCLQPRQFTAYDQAFDPLVTPGDPWTYGGLNRDTGNVHVIIIPGGPLANRAPAPTAELLQEVSDYLEQRRTVTAALNVTGPRYLPIKVTAQIMVWKKAVDTGLVPDPTVSNQVRDDITAKIVQFLHPVLGNLDGHGWEIGEDQTIAPLFEFIKPSSEVGFISALQIQADTPLYTPPTRLYPVGVPGVWVKFADYEMVCSAELLIGVPSHVVTVTKI
jgi:hypothetical protein